MGLVQVENHVVFTIKVGYKYCCSAPVSGSTFVETFYTVITYTFSKIPCSFSAEIIHREIKNQIFSDQLATTIIYFPINSIYKLRIGDNDLVPNPNKIEN